MVQPNYTAALYLRLSKDDGFSERESMSIDTQRDMLTRYCKEHGIIVYDIYADDGFTGLNTDRPAFQRMIEDVENRKVNCVITKDQSRLGRNHLESDFYMEVFFPEHNIRYIAVTDNVDTLNASTLDIAPFRNLLNDMYSQDVSKKVKSALKARQQQGKFIGSKATYGYLKDPNDKNHLIIDERYAPVIRRIFDMYLDEGMGCGKIAQVLTAERIPRPHVAAAEELEFYSKYSVDDTSEYRWTAQSVSNIIRNPVYAGHLRGQHRVKISPKSDKRKPMGSNDIIVKNTHEPIIAPDRWEVAQEIIKSRRKDRIDDGFENVFTGLLKCAECGKSLTMSRCHRRSPRPDPIDMVGYMCNGYRTFGKAACSTHWIEARDLYETVLSDIKAHAEYAIAHDELMIEKIISKMNSDVTGSIRDTERAIKKAKARLTELDRLFASLYEDKVVGNVSERNFKQLSANYENEQIRLENEIKEKEQLLRTIRVTSDNADTFIEMIKQYADIEKLTTVLTHKLIDKIIIHSPEETNGEKTQKIEIYYKFVGRLD